jgi:hypothetical protein
MTLVTEKDLVAHFAENLFFPEASEALNRLIKGGYPSFSVNSENTDAQVFQKLAKLLVQNIGFDGRYFSGHG